MHAPFKINIINKGNSKIIFSGGCILIKDDKEKILCRNEIIGHRKGDWNLDFKLEVNGRDQFLDCLFLELWIRRLFKIEYEMNMATVNVYLTLKLF